jgi:uncharacterized protein (TIGR01777 family)
MRVFVTGGTGLVGSLLVRRLRERGDHVVVLSRRAEAQQQIAVIPVTSAMPGVAPGTVAYVAGDPTQAGPWMDAVAGCDAVVNLAGEGIFNRRWSPEFKELIRSSRVKATENVVAAMQKAAQTAMLPSTIEPAGPRNAGGTLINASAVGIYGPHGDEEITEEALPGNDFLATVCMDWERAALAANTTGTRVVLLRTGIVLDKGGGALAQMLTPFKLFVGGKVGSGKQWMSWIHNEDEVGLILFALDHSEINGPFNAVAPNPVPNREFSIALGKVLGRPSVFPTPAFMLKLMLGESAEIVTTGQRVRPRKALEAGYEYKFPELEAALRNLL